MFDIYEIIKPDILKRINEFQSVWSEADEKRLFQELAFCLLTPQSKALNAWKTIIKLTENQKLLKGNTTSIAEDLNLVRFRNNKASYLVEAREMFFNNSKGIRKTLTELSSVSEKRNWLNKNIKGYGLKESSHFLRNIGFGKEIAILDRHILRNLLNYKVINEIPKSISEKKYYEMESRMKDFSYKINIPLEYLDFVLWFKETNKLFK